MFDLAPDLDSLKNVLEKYTIVSFGIDLTYNGYILGLILKDNNDKVFTPQFVYPKKDIAIEAIISVVLAKLAKDDILN